MRAQRRGANGFDGRRLEPKHHTLRRLATALSSAPGGLRSAGITALRGRRPAPDLVPADTAEDADVTRSTVLGRGRTRTLEPLVGTAFGTGTSVEVVLAGHALAVAAAPAHDHWLLKHRLPEQPAEYFNMAPDALRDPALRLSRVPEGGLL